MSEQLITQAPQIMSQLGCDPMFWVFVEVQRDGRPTLHYTVHFDLFGEPQLYNDHDVLIRHDARHDMIVDAAHHTLISSGVLRSHYRVWDLDAQVR